MSAEVDLAGRQAAPERSYRDILKSTAWVGSSAVFNVAIGMVRTKLMALLLGPAGFGLMSACMQVAEVGRNVAQMGINASAVRQISAAASSGRQEAVSRTAAAIHWMSLICGAAGLLAVSALCEPIAEITFGSRDHANEIAGLGWVVFFSVLAGGQTALLQGLRRIADLSKLTVISGAMGTGAAVALVAAFGRAGIVPALIAVALASAWMSWRYCKKHHVTPFRVAPGEMLSEGADLLKLGVAFMASGLLMAGASYVTRTLVLRQLGLDAAGMFSAAWTLGGLYIGFVLQALGTDFYPRLVGSIDDAETCNRLVNEQSTVSLLLALPGVLITLACSHLALTVFYSASFAPASEILRWICLGMALRVLTWPVGYIIVARNRQVLFFAVEAVWAIANVSLTWMLVHLLGAAGAGMAFFASYLVHALVVYPVARHLTGFRWSPVNLKIAAGGAALIGLVFTCVLILPAWLSATVNAMACVGGAYVALRTLVRLAAPQRLPRILVRLLKLRPLRPS
jgi:PST family polysaccharide transporter